VGIREGDDLRVVARNFCKTYSLGKDMEQNLLKNLESHLQNYYAAKAIEGEMEMAKKA
jgi:hypothetical protein